MTNLDQITETFNTAYTQNKQAKDELAIEQNRFFAALTEDLAKGPLPQRSVELPDGADAEEFAKRHHPGFRVNEVITRESGRWAILEEDPALMKHSYLNQSLGMVFGRTVAEGSPSLDDEQLREEDPELWERVTEWPEPWYSLVRDAASQVVLQIGNRDIIHQLTPTLEDWVDNYLQTKNIQRVLKPFDSLNDNDLEQLSQYFVPGTRTVRLVAPRKATKEELEDNE